MNRMSTTISQMIETRTMIQLDRVKTAKVLGFRGVLVNIFQGFMLLIQDTILINVEEALHAILWR